jgi:hypothetical protein
MEGFGELGHRVHYVPVRRHDNRDLARQIRRVERDDELVIFEYEPAIFWLGGLVRAMAWLRFWRRKRVLLSVHEIGPDKYAEARQIRWHLARPVSRRGPLAELGMLLLSTGDVTLRFLLLRVGLLLMGWLPHEVLIHSPKAADNLDLTLADDGKVHYVPHVVKRLEGDRTVLRRQLGLPGDSFAFIAPGFLFRRKRIVEVIEELPPCAELWIVGTESDMDPGYLDEIRACLSNCAHSDRVRLIQDYERMAQYLMAADAAVFFYSEGYQSGVASLAVGAAKPCIFSDLPAFSDLREAGLTARTSRELHEAMVEIQQPTCHRRLAEAASALRDKLAPGPIARQYLATLSSSVES